jgi:hypothetical protein
MLLGFGIGCLGVYAYETVEARRFQAEQTAAFERGARAQVATTVVKQGGLVGMLDVPRLQLSTPVIQGDDTGTLKRAVGHLPDTPMPWDTGNSAIAGHRDGLFRPLKNVKIGDEIRFRTTRDEFRYRVTETTIVEARRSLGACAAVRAGDADADHLLSLLLRRFRSQTLRRARRPPVGRDLPVIDRIISGSA